MWVNTMRTIDRNDLKNAVKTLLLDANHDIGASFLNVLKRALETETSKTGRDVLQQIIDNDTIAKEEHVPMCQDTGMVVAFVKVGRGVILDFDLDDAINDAVKEAYDEGYLRKSVVADPFRRENTGDNTPAIVHVSFVDGDALSVTVAPKGAGSENMSLVKMLLPSEGPEGVKDLLLHTIFEAGGKPCPPLTVGVGIGGNLEKAALIAKEALMRPVDDIHPDPYYADLEKKWCDAINRLGVGPMGFGGKTTALAVKIATYPCHIASLPVAINIQCHASRHKSVTL